MAILMASIISLTDSPPIACVITHFIAIISSAVPLVNRPPNTSHEVAKLCGT